MEKKIVKKTSKYTCRHCGAPVLSEICPYCSSRTGIETEKTPMEYPIIECKEAHLSFWDTAFPAIFAVSFGWFGFYMPVFFYKVGEIEETWTLLFFIPFATVGIAATYIVLSRIWRYITVVLFGKEIEGVVYGFQDDNVLLNGNPAQVAKILLHTPNGPRFIMYQLGNTSRPFKANDRLMIKVYKDRFKIIDTHKYDAWK